MIGRQRWCPFLLLGLVILLTSWIVACGQPVPSLLPPVLPPAQPPTATESQPPAQSPPAVEAANGGEWNTVETFTGKGNKVTSPFHISGTKWRITWTVDAEYPKYTVFDLFVYPDGRHSIFTKRISHSGGSASDAVYIYEGGWDYYIKVIAVSLCTWTITVEDYATKASLSPVQITRINYEGRDYLESLKMGYEIVEADEYVEIKNQGDCRQVIGGWMLKNISKGCPSFTFPVNMPCSCAWFDDYEDCIEHCVPPSPCGLAPHQSIRVYTGEVHSESGGFCCYYFPGDIWDNGKPDIAVLYNSRGEEVSRKSYAVPTRDGVPAGE